MKIREQYPLINKIMDMHLHADTNPYIDCRRDPDFCRTQEDIETTIENLKSEAASGVIMSENTLNDLMDLYDYRESIADDHAFVEGFMSCAELFSEIASLRAEMLHRKEQ